MSSISLSALKKTYRETEVVRGVDLDIADGEFVVFVGPSGCGKSTLLKMIAGLEEITDGDISIGGQSVKGVAPAKRGIAMVFQSYALYPHMTVFNNIAFGLRISGLSREAVRIRVGEVARILMLDGLLERYPRHLSGGQRQRVAIGRAIARKPRVLLFDEPLSNLDAALRSQTRVEIARLHQSLGATIIYVTHDQVEAMTLAERIVLLNEGRIEQVGAPLELYNSPANLFVARFLGSPGINVLPVLDGAPAGAKSSAVRPEKLQLSAAAFPGSRPAVIDLVEHLGDMELVHLSTSEGHRLIAKAADSLAYGIGQSVHVGWEAGSALHFDSSGARIVA